MGDTSRIKFQETFNAGYEQALEDFVNNLNRKVYRIDDSATLSTRDVVNQEDIEETRAELLKNIKHIK